MITKNLRNVKGTVWRIYILMLRCGGSEASPCLIIEAIKGSKVGGGEGRATLRVPGGKNDICDNDCSKGAISKTK